MRALSLNFAVLAAALVLGTAPAPALAETRSLEIALNDEAARGTYTMPLRGSGLDVDFGWLHNTDDGNVFHSGIYVAGFAGKGNSAIELALGGRLLFANSDVDDGSGFAVGGRGRYSLPQLKRMRLGAHLFFAPSSTSFGDVDEILDAGVSVGYLVLNNVELFLDASTVRFEFDGNSSVTVDNGVHVGFRARF